MTEKELKFMDYLMPKLSETYPNHLSVSCINDYYKEETGINIDYREINILVDNYDGEYFDKITPMGHVRITPKWKKIIDQYGSLSDFLINEGHQKQNQTKRQTLKNIIPTTIQAIGLIVMIVFGVLTIKFDNDKKELKNDIVIKDSIINELKLELNKSDSLNIN
jgi:hypothetical protein